MYKVRIDSFNDNENYIQYGQGVHKYKVMFSNILSEVDKLNNIEVRVKSSYITTEILDNCIRYKYADNKYLILGFLLSDDDRVKIRLVHVQDISFYSEDYIDEFGFSLDKYIKSFYYLYNKHKVD